MVNYLSFEKPLSVIEGKIRELNELNLQDDKGKSYVEEINKLEVKAQETLESLYKDLNTWEKTQVARHPERPHFLDYSNGLVRDFVQLSGDRVFGEDSAIIGGIGKLENISVMLIGHEKGYDTETRIKHNFGMAHPEGYRKSIRLMNIAERFNLPVITFVDTPGAYPGIGAEERGQSEAIARSTDRTLSLGVPVISIIIGEGGSGGAIAIAAANKVYSLVSPVVFLAKPAVPVKPVELPAVVSVAVVDNDSSSDNRSVLFIVIVAVVVAILFFIYVLREYILFYHLLF